MVKKTRIKLENEKNFFAVNLWLNFFSLAHKSGNIISPHIFLVLLVFVGIQIEKVFISYAIWGAVGALQQTPLSISFVGMLMAKGMRYGGIGKTINKRKTQLICIFFNWISIVLTWRASHSFSTPLHSRRSISHWRKAKICSRFVWN